jgi:replication factor A1
MPKLFYNHLKSIALLANKQDVDPKRLVNAFFNALKTTRSHCGGLTITCREVTHDTATFLIENDEKVVWQSPLNLEILKNPHLGERIKAISKRTPTKKYSKDQKIAGLRYGMKKINVTATIIKKPPAIGIRTRWGSQARVSNVTIADDTGSVRLSLWNHQIDKVHIGDVVELKNCYVARYARTLQVRLGRKGTITVVDSRQQDDLIQHSISV